MSQNVNTSELQSAIEAVWEERQGISSGTTGVVRDTVETTLNLLDKGEVRVAEKGAGGWTVNQWLKKAVLLSFRLNDMVPISGAPGGATWWDKVPSKFDGMTPDDFRRAGFRAVPGCIVRRSAYIAPGVVMLPSFVNLGAYIDEGTMVDTWATVGSCAQIGKNCHISGGAGIGGVLEPLQAGPVIIEDNCFIGARAEVAEGVIVGEGSVLSMGVYLGASTTIIDRATGEKFFGKVPPYSVVVSGSMPPKKPLPDGTPGPNLYCAVIVKKVDAQTRSKTSINELLRTKLYAAGGRRERLGRVSEKRMNSYRNLASQKIVETLTTLASRIAERFPRSGLLNVCRELTLMAEQTNARADKIARRNIPLLALIAGLLALAGGTVVWLAFKALNLEASTELTNVMQGVDAGVSLLIVLGGAAFYLSSLESRWRRRAVLKALHEFRSIAHVIDMHQLTKDPSALGGPRTSSSPDREMTRFELVRYLSYCSEMLSLASKSAAVYAEKIDDPAVVDAVGDIERLTTNLSQKIWQKITLVETELEDVRGAKAVSAGELSFSHHAKDG